MEPSNTAPRKKKRMPLWAVILTDVLLIGTVLIVFALFHHVLPQKGGEPVMVVTTAQSSAGETTKAGDTTSPVSLTWKEKFAGHFTDTVVQTADSYTSPNVSIQIQKVTTGSGNSLVTYSVADIYIADIECFGTYLAENTYGSGYRDTVPDMDIASGALLAMTGDYYGNSAGNNGGVVVRNGKLYRAEATDCDVGALYYDGTVRVFAPGTFDAREAVSRGVWQAWTFGPMLLDADGKAMKTFNSSVTVQNPRSGFGYYEPGHYCFILVDGRQDGYSVGVTMAQYAKIFEQLGCKSAYNLDGGQSAAMTFNDTFVNRPYKGGRSVSDCLIIREVQP